MPGPVPFPTGEVARLESLRKLRILDTSPEPAFDDTARLAALICDTPVAAVGFIDEKREWFKAKIGIDLDQIPREESFSSYAILQTDVLIIHDAQRDERFKSNPLVTQAGISFYAGMPLISVDGQAVGTLAVMDRIPHLLTAEQVDSLQIVARRILNELELRRAMVRGLRVARKRQPSATILLVEDNSNLSELLQRTLEGAGFSVLSATDGLEAIRLFEQHEGTIHLVLTDISMPHLNGIQLAERIWLVRPKMKLMFITGFADQFPEATRLAKNGANILEKPFLPSELVRRVEEILNQGDSLTGTEG